LLVRIVAAAGKPKGSFDLEALRQAVQRKRVPSFRRWGKGDGQLHSALLNSLKSWHNQWVTEWPSKLMPSLSSSHFGCGNFPFNKPLIPGNP